MPTYTQQRAARRKAESRVKKGLAKALPDKKAKLKTATTGKSPRQKATYYEQQAAKNLRMAGDVKRSKTGNVKAEATHRSVAKQYKAKARKLRAGLVARKKK